MQRVVPHQPSCTSSKGSPETRSAMDMPVLSLSLTIKISYFRVGSKCYKDPPRSKYFRGGPNTSTMMCNIWTPGSIYYYSIWTGGPF